MAKKAEGQNKKALFFRVMTIARPQALVAELENLAADSCDPKHDACYERACQLKRDFSHSIMASIQDFSIKAGMADQVNFSNSHVAPAALCFSCTDSFVKALEKADIPGIGQFRTPSPPIPFQG